MSITGGEFGCHPTAERRSDEVDFLKIQRIQNVETKEDHVFDVFEVVIAFGVCVAWQRRRV